MAFAAPMATSEITYFQTETTYFVQAADVGFAARAPPLAVSNIAGAGGVTVMHGGAFTLHGQETVAALFGFSVDSTVTNTGPVRIGETTIFGDSVKRSVVGDGLSGDHMPSRAALQSRVEADIGRPLTQAEASKLRNSTGCVIVNGGGHCALSNTFGGRNTPSKISNDVANPRAAADADFDAMIPDFRASGMSSAQINAARTRLHNLNGSIINDLNTEFGTQIRYEYSQAIFARYYSGFS